MACKNVVVSFKNGSINRSDTAIAPIGAYPDVMPFAIVMMSGW